MVMRLIICETQRKNFRGEDNRKQTTWKPTYGYDRNIWSTWTKTMRMSLENLTFIEDEDVSEKKGLYQPLSACVCVHTTVKHVKSGIKHRRMSEDVLCICNQPWDSGGNCLSQRRRRKRNTPVYLPTKRNTWDKQEGCQPSHVQPVAQNTSQRRRSEREYRKWGHVW